MKPFLKDSSHEEKRFTNVGVGRLFIKMMKDPGPLTEEYWLSGFLIFFIEIILPILRPRIAI